jgi:subtilase family serine protease
MKISHILVFLALAVLVIGCAKQSDTGLPPVPKTGAGQSPSQPAASGTSSADLTLDLPGGKLVASGQFDTATKLDIAARLINIGAKDSGEFTATLYANEDKIYETRLSLGAGQKKIIEYLWKPPAKGDYNLKLVIDSNNEVTESEEKNNIFEFPVPITEPQS